MNTASAQRSVIEMLQAAPKNKVLDWIFNLEDREAVAAANDWNLFARPNQMAPDGEWIYWLLLAGRGFGKTRTGAEWIVQLAEIPNLRLALIAPTSADARDVMVEGESGVLGVAKPYNRPIYEPSKRRLVWPNGTMAFTYSAEEPERLRGPQHHFGWCDEIAAWQYMDDTWDMFQMGLRLGDNPRAVITTTPRPLKLIRELLADKNTHVTRGTTYDNKANLAPAFVKRVITKYEGTRLGRQELNAEILDDLPGALWQRSNLDATRVGARPANLARVVVAVDPAVSNNEGSDEHGIVVAAKGVDDRGYVLADCSLRGTPNEWAETAITAYDVNQADAIVVEANQGGDMVEHTLRSTAKAMKQDGKRGSEHVSIRMVHATRGKVTRAEPVSALYEQNRVSHCGTFGVLEDQMCQFTSDFNREKVGYSPDRVDALVWALTDMFLGKDTTGIIEFTQQIVEKRKQAEALKTQPVPIKDKTQMRGPSNISSAFGQSGKQYNPSAEGIFYVEKDDVVGLLRAGFEKV